MVYVPYCSSDAHMGDSEHEVGKGEMFPVENNNVWSLRSQDMAYNNSGVAGLPG